VPTLPLGQDCSALLFFKSELKKREKIEEKYDILLIAWGVSLWYLQI
jgi:hypothetical protein